ncbi:MAG: hypothetical protein IIZ50_05390, partial [Bifidobacterium sp.]|nr:hypothetical protein [Bifidobacterium sp.]
VQVDVMLVGARNIGIGVRLSCIRSQWTFLIARSFVSILKFPGERRHGHHMPMRASHRCGGMPAI